MALIPFDDRDGSIWYDGKLVPWREAQTHVLTHVVNLGKGAALKGSSRGPNLFVAGPKKLMLVPSK